MILYELVISLSHRICKKGYIWCKDGSFIHPSKFKNSGKVAYGYTLEDGKVVSIWRSASIYKWAGSEDSPFYERITSAKSTTDGVSNSDALKSIPGYSPINCPAIYQCLSYSNSGKSSYMPAINELENLYQSIMHGRMKTDLITAGIYEECNYRLDNSSGIGWKWIWSSSQYPSDSYCNSARYVLCTGSMYAVTKTSTYYIVPFFDFNF